MAMSAQPSMLVGETVVPEPPQAGSYRVVYADPPWLERGGGQIKRGADRHYPLMPTDAICRLPVWRWAGPNAHCYMWVTNNFLPDGLRVMSAWGFRFVSLVTWFKSKRLAVDVCEDCLRYAHSDVSTLRSRVRDSRPQALEILQPEVRRVGPDCSHRVADADSPEPRPAGLELQGRNDAVRSRLPDALSAEPSIGKPEERPGAGAQGCDVQRAGEASEAERDRSSHQRRQVGQPTGESSDHDAQLALEGAASRHLSELLACVLCGQRDVRLEEVTVSGDADDYQVGLGQYFRGVTESCLFGVRGSLPYQSKDGKRAQGRTGFHAPRGQHSAKPEKMRQMIELVSPGPRLEMFARRPADGWDLWGNQAPEQPS